jgi:UDP-GlcNAc:undecaprenyl-phosphate GlcNAc-1-phosphate transferase
LLVQAGVTLLRRTWIIGMLRLILFGVIPYLVFVAHLELPFRMSASGQVVYHLSFGLLAFMAVMTLKFTRRQKGFRANPFDFLIVLISFFITSIPTIKNMVADVSLITAEMIALFFAFEVLLGEVRNKIYRLDLFIAIALGTVFVKSLI